MTTSPDPSLVESLNLYSERASTELQDKSLFALCSKSRANFAKRLETEPGLRLERARFPRYKTVINHCAAASVIALSRLAPT